MQNAAPTEEMTQPRRPFDNTHGRNWDFEEFEFLGPVFTTAVIKCFRLYSQSVVKTTAEQAYSALMRLARFINRNQDALLPLIQIIQSDHTKAKASDWEGMFALWRGDLMQRTDVVALTKYRYLNKQNTIIKRLVSHGIIPEVAYLNTSARALRNGRAVPCLAELHPPHVHGASKKILEAALSTTSGITIGSNDKRDFLTSLFSEMGEIPESPEEQAEALFKINSDRLELLRSCACKEFQQSRDHLLKGTHLIQGCDLEFEEIAGMINYRARNSRERAKVLSTLFPIDDQDVALSRLLKYFADHPDYRGKMPKYKGSRRPHKWFESLRTRFGGHANLQAYLFPDSKLTTSVITIFLCDTGANVSVARTLTFACLTDSSDRRFKIVAGNKMRAGGKLVIGEIPIKDSSREVSCVEAIETYQKSSERIREHAPNKEATQLFLQLQQIGVVRTIGAHLWTDWFRAFCNRHPTLKKLRIESRMIRPSVLLRASHENESGIHAAQAVGSQASLGTTWSYTAKFPNYVIYEAKIRKFQSLFQAVSIYSLKGAAEKLGLTEKKVGQLFGEACRTGLGVLCRDPKAGVQPGSPEGEDCVQLHKCPTCPNRIVVASVENLTDLILFNRHLEKNRPWWERERPERWEKDWLPWLVFTEVVMGLAGRGRTVNEFMKAKARADELQGSVSLPPLW